MEINQIATTGDARRLALSCLNDLRRGDMKAAEASAAAALLGEINKSMQVETNAAKLAHQLKDEVHNFGRVVQMGQRLIGG